jgi:hypothetical protein
MPSRWIIAEGETLKGETTNRQMMNGQTTNDRLN